MINHMFILNLPPGSVWEVFWPKQNCYGPSLQHERGELIIIIIIIIYTPTQVHRVTMVGGELKVTTSMYRR